MEKILQKLVEQDEDGSIVLDFDDEEETDG